MNITIHEKEPIEFFPYLEVGSGQLNNGSPVILNKTLPIYLGEFNHQQAEVDFLIICSDLQGIVEQDGMYKLVGEELPDFLKLLINIELTKVENTRVGVFLCGDLYTNLEKRGASGDVRNVWLRFKEQFDWVIGVAGNHDRFGNDQEAEDFKNTTGLFLLHQEDICQDGFTIGGISGIIGRGDKAHRVDEKVYLKSLDKLLKKELDFILLHESPDYPQPNS